MEDLLAITGQDVPLTEEADIMDRKKMVKYPLTIEKHISG